MAKATVAFNIRRDQQHHSGAHRMYGEWFAPHPDILAEIDRLNAENRNAA